MRLFAGANYPFIANQRYAFWASGIAIGLGIIVMIANTIMIGSWLDYGVDFTGGTLVQVQFQQPVRVEQIREALAGAGAPEITRFGEESEFIIRAPLAEQAAIEGVADTIEEALRARFGQDAFTVVRTELVGPKIGGELQQKAGFAILFSFLLTLIYLAVRFEFRFGLAAVIATAHDILFTLGFLAGFRIEVGLPTVAAVLTIVGYSLNDTIIVFDRIRENLKKAGRRPNEPELVNGSINQTLPRTVLTSGTTLIVLFTLYLLGGAVIRDFAAVLIVGILVGTYSSIFVASPALLIIRRYWAAKTAKKERRAAAAASV
ncbi:MAG: protein translocase subunit SecF [Gemmatimonadetes bacterium]|nr:protein translocase subunit SecF [Gemmatimonadota bacterium]